MDKGPGREELGNQFFSRRIVLRNGRISLHLEVFWVCISSTWVLSNHEVSGYIWFIKHQGIGIIQWPNLHQDMGILNEKCLTNRSRSPIMKQIQVQKSSGWYKRKKIQPFPIDVYRGSKSSSYHANCSQPSDITVTSLWTPWCLNTGVSIVCSAISSGADQRKHQSSASLAFVRENHRSWWIPLTKGQ